MANIKNFGLAGIGTDVQFGKSGPRIVNESGTFKFKNSTATADAGIEAMDVMIKGNLTVQGSTTTLDVQTLTIKDKNIVVGSNTDTTSLLDGAGISVGTSELISFNYDNATNAWKSSQVINLSGNKLINVGAGVSGNDGINWSQFNSAITTLTTNLASEVTNRTNSGTTINGLISTETTNRTTAVSALQAEVDAIETGTGLNTDGTYTAPGNTNYLSTTTSLKQATINLDTQVKSVADSVQSLISGFVSDMQTNTAHIRASVGLNSDGTLNPFTGANYIYDDPALTFAILDLDDQLFTTTTLANTNASNISTEIAARTALGTNQSTAFTSLGLGTNGSLVAFTGNYTNGVASFKVAIDSIDTALKTEVTNRIAAINGLGTLSTQNANAVAITGGAINNTAIGATTAASGVFTALSSTNLTATGVSFAGTGGLLATDTTNFSYNSSTHTLTTTNHLATLLNVKSTDLTTTVLTADGGGNTVTLGTAAGSTTINLKGTVTATGNIVAATAPTISTHLTNKAYVDSLVAGGVVNGAHAIATAFTSTATTTLATITGFIHRIKVYINTPGASATAFTIGTDANNTQLVDVTDIDASTAGVYIIELAQNYASATVIKLFNTGGAGAGTVVFEYI